MHAMNDRENLQETNSWVKPFEFRKHHKTEMIYVGLIGYINYVTVLRQHVTVRYLEVSRGECQSRRYVTHNY